MAEIPDDVVEMLWRDLCEKSDRTSPAEHPDMVLVTLDELRTALRVGVEAMGGTLYTIDQLKDFESSIRASALEEALEILNRKRQEMVNGGQGYQRLFDPIIAAILALKDTPANQTEKSDE